MPRVPPPGRFCEEPLPKERERLRLIFGQLEILVTVREGERAFEVLRKEVGRLHRQLAKRDG